MAILTRDTKTGKNSFATGSIALGDIDNQQGWGRRSYEWGAAVLLFIFLFLNGCGEGGDKKKANAACQQGQIALEVRDAVAARQFFTLALEECPALPQANLGMAKVCDHYFFDSKAALGYYKRYFDLEPDADVDSADKTVRVLEVLASGRLENPVSAVEDMLRAAYDGRRQRFFERISDECLRSHAEEGTQPEPLLARLGSFCMGGFPEVLYRMVSGDQQAAAVVIRLRNASPGEGYYQLTLLRGAGDLRNLWQLADLRPLQYGVGDAVDE